MDGGGYIQVPNDIAFVRSYRDSHSSEELLEKSIDLDYQKDPPFYKTHARTLSIHTFFLFFNIAICLAFWGWTVDRYEHGPNLRYSPAREVIEYETRTYDMEPIYHFDGSLNLEKPTHFGGPPTPELEEEWDNLIHYQNIRLSKEELGERGQEDGLIALPDGGYWATLTVYHSLHCVKRVHHLMYADYYYPNLTQREINLLKQHGEHCLDTFRQNIQCAADTTVIPLKWGVSQRMPLGQDTGKHQCANWERLDNWMKDRTFDPMKPGYLIHPTLGPAYPDGKGDELGVASDEYLKTPL
ncbi:MAG: hypothetical protein MMC33_000897 [Icmadophila ericetorum]|nr:hypothetical protein [Icmadophila ericetorum]